MIGTPGVRISGGIELSQIAAIIERKLKDGNARRKAREGSPVL
jgi:hypothetical protein